MKKFILLFLCLVLMSCSRRMVEYQSHMRLDYGMPKQHVLEVLGPPSEKEVYQRKDQRIVEYLIYKNFVSYEPKTPICFINNKLVGWGRTYYQDHLNEQDLRLK